MSGSLRKGTPIPKKFMRKITNLFTGGKVDKSRVYKLLTKAFTLYDNLKMTDNVPTESYILLRCLIFDLYLCFANRIID